MPTSTRRKKRGGATGTNAININSTVATVPTTNNTPLTFTQKIVKIEKISTPTPTHREKRAKTTGTNATNDTVATATATTNNNATIQLQNMTTQVNAMKNEFDVKLSQVTNIQRDQQYQLEILRSENTKLVKKNDELQLVADENKELRRELNQMKETINEMKNEFKKQVDDLKKKDSTNSRPRRSTMTQKVQSKLSTATSKRKKLSSTQDRPINNKKVKHRNQRSDYAGQHLNMDIHDFLGRTCIFRITRNGQRSRTSSSSRTRSTRRSAPNSNEDARASSHSSI